MDGLLRPGRGNFAPSTAEYSIPEPLKAAAEVCRRRWPRAITVAIALLGSIWLAAGCGPSGHSATGSRSAPTTSTSSIGAISGPELKSLPKLPAATGPPPSPSPNATTVDRTFLEKVFNDAQRLWAQAFTASRLPHSPARLVMFASNIDSACGSREKLGPFYCPADHGIYLDLRFFDLLARQAGLGGFAQAYVIAHEFGHHIQHLLGIDRRVAAANQANPAGENTLPVREELQADCLAGVWAHSYYSQGELSVSDLEDKLKTAALMGDDYETRGAREPADPGLFTHGSPAQRQRWLRTGFESGEPGACDTFSEG